MSSGWQEAAAQQAEEVSARLRQLLITGLGLLRSELGLELGLEPQRYPSWVFLAVPVSLGLFFLFLLLHCATSRSAPSTKRGAQHEKEQPVTQARAPVPNKVLKVEEPKKRSKKKAAAVTAEKAKPNGRPVELNEEVVIPAVKKESPKPTLDAEKKNEKLKKNKKKPKADVKQTQPSANQDKKEAEEGNWETKISNKEKRQQRKRDKGADADVSVSDSVVESFTVISTQSANIRKAKGPSEASALNGGSWNEKPTKVISSQLVEEKWQPVTNTTGKKKAEPCTWNQDTVDSNGKEWSAPWSERSIFPGIATWSSVDTRLNSSEQRPPFSTIGLSNSVSASVSDPVSQTNVTDNQWEATPTEPNVDDEWSGLNGLNSSDPSSDWNAPAEEWGNYGEEEPAPSTQTEQREQDVPKASDEDKEKEDLAAQTANKTKKKKKKKKKQGEESGSPTQESENSRDIVNDYKEVPVPPSSTPVIPTGIAKSNEQKEASKKQTVQEKRLHTVFTEAPATRNSSEKSSVQAQQPQEANASVTKQNNVSPPSQAKSEESWESPKQVKKKKKARRET